MSITVEKNQGIRLQLASAVPTPLHMTREAGGYYKVRSYHGGGEFFQQENAQVILQCLGEFLPRTVERPGINGGMEIFFQHLVNGQDVCSSTAPLNSGVDVPKSEIDRLEEAIKSLKAKENDPGTDPTKREIIRAFRLPSPQKDPELYRLYSNNGSRRLLVLWGVEKEAGTSLSPQEALNRVPLAKRSFPWWPLMLLALILLALLGWWLTSKHPQPDNSSYTSATPDMGQNHDSGNKSPSETKVGTAPPFVSTNPVKSGIKPSVPPTATHASAITTVDPSKPSAQPATSQPGGPPASTPSAPNPPVSATVPTNPPDGAKATGTSTAPPAIPASPSVVKPVGGGVQETSRPEPPSLPHVPGRAVTPQDDLKKADSKMSSETPPAPTPLRAQPASAPPNQANGKNNNPTPAPASKPSAPGSPNTSLPPASPPPIPLTAEIVNARTSAAPKDGKVEMQLSVMARDSDGKAITISKVEGWTVDGKAQSDDAAHPITANGLPVRLTEGVHRVRVTGVAADGRPIAAEADVKVEIAVKQESTVKVEQVGKSK